MAARSKNIFSYLDSDDEDIPKQQKKNQPTTSAPVPLNKPAAGNKKSKKPVVESDKSEKKENRAPREPREPRYTTRGERSGRGRGAGRGGRGGRREFERRSGTGRGKETSKHGGGAHNWGNDNDQTELNAEAEVQESPIKIISDEETPSPEADAEAEEVQLTLDEYMAKKKAERAGEIFAEVESRRVEEDFSGAKQLTKDGKTPDFMEAQFEKVFAKKTSGRKKNLVTDLGFQSAQPERRFRDNDSSRGGRGREGRGRGAGREGRGAGREGRGAGREGRGAGRQGRGAGREGRGSNIPDVSDMDDFPSLG